MGSPARKNAVLAWAAVRDAVLNDEDVRKRVSKALGITYFKVKVILELFRGTVSASQLTQDLASDKTYISLVLSDLEKDGTIERVPSPADRRRKDIVLTAAGHALARKALAILNQPPDGFSRLTAEDLNTLLRLMRKISSI